MVLCLGMAGCNDSDSDRPLTLPLVWPQGDLIAVAVVDDQTALVVAESGENYRSEDLGGSWERARVPAASTLADLVMVDAEVGWSVGPGVVLRTEDGGRIWYRQRLPGRSSLYPLHAVAVVDPETAIATGEGGLLLSTADGGSLWTDVSPGQAESLDAGGSLRAVGCARPPRSICYAAGDGVIVSADHGLTWSGVDVEDAVNLRPFLFRIGGVELEEDSVRPLASRLAGLVREDIDWIVEAFASPEEIERFAGDRDPSALFELLEARAGEVRIALEAAGIDNARIPVGDPPPWGYEEFLGDDATLVARYWETRRRSRPAAIVTVREFLGLTSIAIGAAGAVRAVGAAGRFLESAGAGDTLMRRIVPTPHDLLDLAYIPKGEVAVGRQGALVALLEERPAERRVEQLEVVGGGAVFEALRGVDFAVGGQRGLAIGDQGRMLRSEDGDRIWGAITSPYQEDLLPFR